MKLRTLATACGTDEVSKAMNMPRTKGALDRGNDPARRVTKKHLTVQQEFASKGLRLAPS